MNLKKKEYRMGGTTVNVDVSKNYKKKRREGGEYQVLRWKLKDSFYGERLEACWRKKREREKEEEVM